MKQDSVFGQRGFNGQQQRGGFLIVLGVLLLLGMSDLDLFGYSPWVIMALLPVYWFAIAAYRIYQREGVINRRVLYALIPMLFPFFFVGSAMLGFNLAKVWPVGAIAIGLVYLLFSKR
jgi:hypothetical protein